MRNALNDIPTMYGPEHVAVLIEYNEFPDDNQVWVQVNETTGVFVSLDKFEALRADLEAA